ncbi:GNAT family N-acetyltransferase [Sphingobacterium sp. DK4209]|uniref:GNAT family N-acetyltransferase n=1 Tax=Sphingobacterium zhuxiongii TaxID=2662364 RepID=A0A5Q0QB94_9SPHI|nr:MULTISPECIES: GNAT family N-acetyltransferase [unclassified Sphingobacterium]MVZ65194.1 GNAT family N-acetyltransferase [Sphingobacterium sp. DK4209]QGA26141.1 GNAT family N-acetyltransferase [Sphingobacterium sp. dk4302]
MIKNKIIKSSRLAYYRPSKEDFKAYFAINADPETNLFNPHGPMSEITAHEVFHNIMLHWDISGYGIWMVREVNKSEIIGFGGLSNKMYLDHQRTNLGYRFSPSAWGKGFATELAQTATAFGFEELKKKAIYALVRPSNLASINVLEKCQFNLIDYLSDVQNEDPSLVYRRNSTF